MNPHELGREHEPNPLAAVASEARPSTMAPAPSSGVAGYRDLLRSVFAGRRVVLAGNVVQSNTGRVTALLDLGAERCLVIGTMGTGPVPEPAEVVVVDVDASGIVESIRAWERLFPDPPAEVVDALDRFDPDRRALVLLGFFDTDTTLAGRPVFGSRPASWTALEDKTLADRFFDRAGVARPPSEVVPVRRDDLLAAATRLDRGEGTVWAGDAREGFNGGADYVHWIRDEADAEVAVARLAPHCDKARVAPFLEGVPCSIHGFVTDDGVAAFRPVELVTLRAPSPPRFRYAGTATAWDPHPADREAMRQVARRVGARLRAEVGFRGVFTVDGVVTADGFLPTELNPRFGAGLAHLNVALPDLPLGLLNHAVIAEAVVVDPTDLEALVVPAADATRMAAGWLVVPGPARQGTEEADLDAGTKVMVGPAASGAFVRVTFDPASLPAGQPVAPAVAAALATAAGRFGLALDPLEAAVPAGWATPGRG